MTLRNLNWTFTPEIVTWNTHMLSLSTLTCDYQQHLVILLFYFFRRVCNHTITPKHKHWISLQLLSFDLSWVFFPPFASVTTRVHRLSTLNQCTVMVRDLDTDSQASAVRGSRGQRRMRVGWQRGKELVREKKCCQWFWQRSKGWCIWDILTSDYSSLCICQRCSAVPAFPFLDLRYPCRLCLDSVCLSLCVHASVCESQSSNMRPQRGSHGEVHEVN